MEVGTWGEPRRWRQMARGFLKMTNAPEDECLPLFEEAERLLFSRIRPGHTFRVFDLDFLPSGVQLRQGPLLLTGEAIGRHLKDCDHAVLFCATLGPGAEHALAVAQAKEMALAVVTDAVASALAEIYCEQVSRSLVSVLGLSSARVTSCFSPGYGDLDLSIQKDILQVLDAFRRLGVSVSRGGLLLPRKTVTAVMGIQKQT